MNRRISSTWHPLLCINAVGVLMSAMCADHQREADDSDGFPLSGISGLSV